MIYDAFHTLTKVRTVMGIEPGDLILHYRIVEEIGSGGMGVVCRAHDQKLKRTVALKLLKPELAGNDEYRQRFLREACAAVTVSHPYIAAIHDADEDDGTLFIVMEYVDGQTLRSALRDGPLSVRDARRYAIEVAEGLAKAHEKSLVHRDLKPENVMLASDGHVRILDFGVAKLVEVREDTTTISMRDDMEDPETTGGAVIGTPAYMSPEQARGDVVDHRSDIFSFGSTLYEMLTGTPAFRRATRSQTRASVLHDMPALASALNPRVPSDLERIVIRCLQKNLERRYDNTGDLVADLQDSVSERSRSPHSDANTDDCVASRIRIPTDDDIFKYDAKLQALHLAIREGFENGADNAGATAWASIQRYVKERQHEDAEVVEVLLAEVPNRPYAHLVLWRAATHFQARGRHDFATRLYERAVKSRRGVGIDRVKESYARMSRELGRITLARKLEEEVARDRARLGIPDPKNPT
jgi:serine/threonine protein kinase